MAEVKSTCCYCGVGCGVIIETTPSINGHLEVTGVRGDPDHPANFGRLCSKGSTLHLTANPSLQKEYASFKGFLAVMKKEETGKLRISGTQH